ncbi:hypothetical protein chiPu_0018134 [Chiloscyllium punctatum]|uniref:HTH CENPB-type domain-containing protein n=1 Tax=Chiloscyllium punctatum TaxID=137246 RepID=A0A401RL88_CHIPU|nr:hypothetical protein [Chiloscyllium punctatum]
MYGQNESSVCEVVKNKIKIQSSFAVAPQTVKVMLTASDKLLVMMDKALNLWVEDMNRKHMPIDSNLLQQKAVSLYEDFKKESIEEKDTKPFTARRGWLPRFRNRHNLKNIKITAEAASDEDEAGATFPTKIEEVDRGRRLHPKLQMR